MKLSAVFLVSVNVVAASQAAFAADTASFLQESLSDLPAVSKARPTARPAPKISHSSPSVVPTRSQQRVTNDRRKLTSMTPIADNASLRPFMPGRYLPSEAELQAKNAPPVTASVPQTQAPSPLSGQVSAMYSKVPTTFAPSSNYSGDYVDQLALAAARKVKSIAKRYSQAAPKSVPGSRPVLPGQLGPTGAPGVPALADLIGADPSVTGFPEPPAAGQSALVSVPTPAQSAPVSPTVPQPQQVQQRAGAPFVLPPPHLSKAEESRLFRLVEANLPERVYAHGINGEMRGSSRVNPGLAGVGPPPFPLSSGAGLVSPGMQAGPGMEASFGNWHERDNLPNAGFHTYVSPRMAGPLNVSRSSSHANSSRRTGKQSTFVPTRCQIASSCPVGNSSPVKPVQSRTAKKNAPVKSEFVACYPQYRKYPGG